MLKSEYIYLLGAGARGASAAPGERRGKGGSVPRTDVVAALQAAAARTPPPPSQVGMPGMPAAPAPGGAKPSQAAASVSVGSVSANAAVLVNEGHAGCAGRSCDEVTGGDDCCSLLIASAASTTFSCCQGGAGHLDFAV